MLPHNMGTLDRLFRFAVAGVIIVLYFTGALSGVWTTVLLVVAGAFIVTSFLNFCPLYLPFGISTRGRRA